MTDAPESLDPAALRPLWVVAGLALVGLAILGAMLPVMPSTVFALGAAWCFARSSPRLERWLVEHPRLGPPIRDWRRERAIPTPAKLLAVGSMTVSTGVMAFSAPAHVAGGVALLLAAIGTWIATRPVPTTELPPIS